VAVVHSAVVGSLDLNFMCPFCQTFLEPTEQSSVCIFRRRITRLTFALKIQRKGLLLIYSTISLIGSFRVAVLFYQLFIRAYINHMANELTIPINVRTNKFWMMLWLKFTVTSTPSKVVRAIVLQRAQ
jgi:hypothetical protein